MSWTSATARRTWVVRRFVLAPAVVALTVLVWALLPLGIVVSALVSPVMSGRWRALRLFWLLVVWLSIETVCLAVLLGWWVASGFGRRIRTPYWEGVHYDLAQGMTWVLFGRAERVLNLQVVTEGPDPDAHPGHPLLVASRHAGPGDSLVLVHALLHWYRREPRIVLKDTIAWDPLAGVLLGRIPSRFVTPGGDAGDTLETQVAALATGLDDDDAFVIFPEGGNFTPGRRQRGIDRLRERGLEPMARRAEGLTNVLAPRPGGLLAALDAAPEADVVLVAHTGLDHLLTAADLWREVPMDKQLIMRWWRVPREEVPVDRDARIEWLYDWWAHIDAWVDEHRPEPLPPGAVRRRAAAPAGRPDAPTA